MKKLLFGGLEQRKGGTERRETNVSLRGEILKSLHSTSFFIHIEQ